MSNITKPARVIALDKLTPESFALLKDVIKGCISEYQGSPVTKENKLNNIISSEIGYRSFNQLQASFGGSEIQANGAYRAFDFTDVVNGIACPFCGEAHDSVRMERSIDGFCIDKFEPNLDCGASYYVTKKPNTYDSDALVVSSAHLMITRFPDAFSSDDEAKWLDDNVGHKNGCSTSFVYNVFDGHPIFIHYMQGLLDSQVRIFDQDGAITDEKVCDVVSRSHDLDDPDSISDFIDGLGDNYDTMLICPHSGTVVYAKSGVGGELIEFHANVATAEESSSELAPVAALTFSWAVCECDYIEQS